MHCRTASRALPLAALPAVLLALLLPACPAAAAFEISWPDARTAAMLTPSSLIDFEAGPIPVRSRVDSLAARPGVEGARATLSGGRLYGVREAAGWSARASASLRGVPVGLGLSRLGGELYEERVVSLGVGLAGADGLFLSARARVLGIAARGVDDHWAVAVDAGATKRLLGRVLLGASCENFTRTRIGGSPVATRTVFGAALVLPSISMQWTLLIEESFALSPTLGFEASLTDWLCVRAGVRDAPGRLGFGIGVEGARGSWPAVDLSVQWHPRLGVSSFVSVTIWR